MGPESAAREAGAAPGRAPIVRVQGLSHRAGAKEVLSEVSFEIDRADIFGLVGPRGAGKTTALRAVATLLVPAAGRIEVDGIDIGAEPRAARRRVGFLGADEGVYARLSVREHLEFYADAYRIDREPAISRALALTDLRSLEHRTPATMSRAMRQRLHLARLLLADAAVLVLDEPAADLDRGARLELAELLASLRTSGKTILFSASHLDELTEMASAIAVLDGGRLLARGAPGDIATRAQNQLRGRRSDSPGPTTLKLRVLGRAEDAVRLLEEDPGVRSARAASENVVWIEHVGGDERVAELVRRLVALGVSIVALAPEKDELHDVLVKIAPGTP